MSLVEKLEDKGLALVEEHGADWLERGIVVAREHLNGFPADDLVRGTGHYALDRVEKFSPEIAALGYQQAAAFLGRLAIGQTDQAARILGAYGGGRGAWGAADASVAAAGDAVEAAKRRQDRALEIAKEIGAGTAKAALPLLMAFVKTAVL